MLLQMTRALGGSAKAPTPQRSLARAIRRDPLVRALAALLLCAVAAGILQGYSALTARTINRLGMEDFGLFYASARQYFDSGRLYGPLVRPGSSRAAEARNLNPPHTQLLFLPFGMLSPERALLLWVMLNALLAADVMRVVLRELRPRLLSLRGLATGVFFLAWAPAVALAMTFQLVAIVAWPMVRSWRAARQGHWNRAAIWLGLAASLKVFLLVFLPVLAFRRQFRPFVLALGAVLAAVLVGFAVFSHAAYVDWADQFSEVRWHGHYMNASLWGVLARTFDDFRLYEPLARAPWLIVPLWALGSWLILWVAWARASRRAIDADRFFGILIGTALLVSPLGWVYYFWLAVPPVVATLSRSRTTGVRWRERALLAVAFVGLVWKGSETLWLQPHPVATVTLASMYFWSLLLLWAWLMGASGFEQASVRAAGPGGTQPIRTRRG